MDSSHMATKPSGHKKKSSLSSLYDVLADLDETQLQYLVQEINHTGDQHVAVSQAVSAFESENPSRSLKHVRRTSWMQQPAPAQVPLQRQLSKSQKGKLRLQTAFQRAPSLRQQGQRPTSQEAINETIHHATNSATKQDSTGKDTSQGPNKPASSFTLGETGNPSSQGNTSDNRHNLASERSKQISPHQAMLNEIRGRSGGQAEMNYGASFESLDRSNSPRKLGDNTSDETPWRPRNYGAFNETPRRPMSQATIDDGASIQTKRSVSYKRISRPEFDLPPGITVADLLNLLQAEYTFFSQHSPTSSASPASSFSAMHFTPSPFMLSPSSSFSTSTAPATPHSSSTLPRIRRHASRLDMALEAERSASGFEGVGLSMMEPRPPARTVSLPIRPRNTSMGSMDLFDGAVKGEPLSAQPVVMEGIFDVLENR